MARFTAVLILAAVSLIVIASVMQDVDAGAARVGGTGMCCDINKNCFIYYMYGKGYAVLFMKNGHTRLR